MSKDITPDHLQSAIRTVFAGNAVLAPDDLHKLLDEVLASLAGKSGYNRVLKLRTPFGGGKSHTLAALLHTAPNVRKIAEGKFEPICVGTTTSMRMDRFTEGLVREDRVRGSAIDANAVQDDMVRIKDTGGAAYAAVNSHARSSSLYPCGVRSTHSRWPYSPRHR